MKALLTVPALAAAAALAALAALAGCAATASPNTDATLGDAVRVIRAQQLVDPAATQRNGVRVPTTEGRTVRSAVDRLAEGNKAPAPSTIINVGGGSGGQ